MCSITYHELSTYQLVKLTVGNDASTPESISDKERGCKRCFDRVILLASTSHAFVWF